MAIHNVSSSFGAIVGTLLKVLGALVFLGLLVNIFVPTGRPPSGPGAETSTGRASAAPSPAPAPDPRSRSVVLSNITVDLKEWHKGGFDSVMLANFSITNNNSFPVKDLEVKCEHSANSGTVIDSNSRTIYESFPPGETKHVNKFNMGMIHSQAARSGCRVTGFAFE